MEGPFKVFLEILEGPLTRQSAADKYVIVAGARVCRRHEGNGSLESAANAVAHNSPAELLRDRIAEAGAGGYCRGLHDAGSRFQNERRRRTARASPEPQVFRSFLERFDSHDVTPAERALLWLRLAPALAGGAMLRSQKASPHGKPCFAGRQA